MYGPPKDADRHMLYTTKVSAYHLPIWRRRVFDEECVCGAVKSTMTMSQVRGVFPVRKGKGTWGGGGGIYSVSRAPRGQSAAAPEQSRKASLGIERKVSMLPDRPSLSRASGSYRTTSTGVIIGYTLHRLAQRPDGQWESSCQRQCSKSSKNCGHHRPLN